MGIYFRDFGALAPGEVQLRLETAKRLTGRTDVGGKLLVTNQGVRYRADRVDRLLRGVSADWACDLTDIASVSVDPGGSRRLRGNGPAGLRRKLVILSQAGEEVRIVVADPDAVVSLIDSAMASGR